MDFKNVSEFFNKKKPEKKAKRPTLPETAKDIYDDGSVDEPEMKEEAPEKPVKKAPEELPEIDFPEKQPKPEHRIVEHKSADIPSPNEDEIRQFEDAIRGIVPQEKFEEFTSRVSDDHGFFSEFMRFMEGNDLPEVTSEFLDKDLLAKMKQYYLHKSEGKPHYFHTSDLKRAMQEKMLELQDLEMDWFRHKQRLEEEEALVIEKERTIAEKIEELKNVMEQLKNRKEVSQRAPEEHYFYLADGTVLKSVADLRSALQVMKEDTFEHHVNEEKNDFAEWLGGTFGMHKLAVSLAKADDRDEMVRVLMSAESKK